MFCSSSHWPPEETRKTAVRFSSLCSISPCCSCPLLFQTTRRRDSNLDLSKALNNRYCLLLLRIEGYTRYFGFLLLKIHILAFEVVIIKWIIRPKTKKNLFSWSLIHSCFSWSPKQILLSIQKMWGHFFPRTLLFCYNFFAKVITENIWSIFGAKCCQLDFEVYLCRRIIFL